MLKRVFERVSLVAGGLFVAALFLELLLRLAGVSYPNLYRPDPYCGSALREDAEGWYREESSEYIRINHEGQRDREHTRTKQANTLRIAVLGDSYAAAFQVRAEQAFWAVMEREINGALAMNGSQATAEVINFGVGGYGTAQELLTLRHRVWDYSPDLVVLAFFTGNDVRNNLRVLNEEDWSPYLVHKDGDLVLDESFLSLYRTRQGLLPSIFYGLVDYSRLLQTLKAGRYAIYRMARLRQQRQLAKNAGLEELGLDDAIYQSPINQDWAEAWSVTEDLLTLMSREVTSRGASFLLVTLSNGDQVSPDRHRREAFAQQLHVPDLLYPDRRIEALGQKEGFPVLTLAPILQSYADRHSVFLHGFGSNLGNGHWNSEGHRQAGILIAERLREQMVSLAQNLRTGGHP